MADKKERPILFSAPMVRAILDGRKTMTRRAVKPQHFREDHGEDASGQCISAGWYPDLRLCPYGQPGDRLWVRETWRTGWSYGGDYPTVQYRATETAHVGSEEYPVIDVLHGKFGVPDPTPHAIVSSGKWKPSIHMPRWASRILLEVVRVRVERLQDISGMDAKREGVSIPAHLPHDGADLDYARREFRRLWQSINGPGSWDANPLVWVIEFKRAENKA